MGKKARLRVNIEPIGLTQGLALVEREPLTLGHGVERFTSIDKKETKKFRNSGRPSGADLETGQEQGKEMNGFERENA